MVLAVANSAGGPSTLSQLEGLVVLIWAIAGAVAVLGWIGRRRGSRPVRSLQGMGRALLVWLRRSATGTRDQLAAAGAPAPDAQWATGAPQQPSATASAATAQPADTVAVRATPANSPEQQASVADATAIIPPPANPGVRYSPETLELLGQHLDNGRRLAVVEDRLAPVVSALPHDRWLVERYVVFAGHRIPFLILGETGVFAVWALGGQPRWNDVPVLGRVAEEVKDAFPGYAGTVQAGVCRPFAPDVQPRWWCRGGEPGVWVMGLNWVIPWLLHFGPEHGLGVKDIERLRDLAGPRWGRGVTDLPPSALVPEIGQVIPG